MEWENATVRFALYLNLMLVFGLPLFSLYSFTASERDSGTAKLFLRLSKGNAGSAIVLSIAGLIVSVKMMSGAESYTDISPDAFPMILFEMSFGIAWLIRLAALVLFLIFGSAFLAKRSTHQLSAMAFCGATALATLAWGGHGVMNEGAKGLVHLISHIIHLIAAGAWVGGLASFVLLLPSLRKTGSDEVARLSRMLSGFALMGTIVVGTLLMTGAINYLLIVGPRFGGLVTSHYGILLSLKLTFFLAMLALAAANRYRLAPMLEASVIHGKHGPAIAGLRGSLILESGCALVILALIACLGMLNPV